MDKLSIAKAKELRGEIIRKLYTCYESPVLIASLNTLLRYNGYYSKEDIKRAMNYLSDEKKHEDNYVRINLDKDDYWASFAQLTPEGVKLAEGDRTDAGVLFNE